MPALIAHPEIVIGAVMGHLTPFVARASVWTVEEDSFRHGVLNAS